jgi:XTP/dITP diphosphohydrolase
LNNILLIASGNPGKVQEIRAIFSCLDLKFRSVIDSDLKIKVQEIGKTYAENARLKAEAYHKRTGLMTLADDSGLEVDVLDGAPGIRSARFSPKENATDSDRRQYLLQQLRNKPQPWKAHFHCSAVLVASKNEVYVTEGHCDGLIIPEERGTGGFGYDPIFYIPSYDATMAQIPADLKNQISHRAKALNAMIPILKEICTLSG